MVRVKTYENYIDGAVVEKMRSLIGTVPYYLAAEYLSCDRREGETRIKFDEGRMRFERPDGTGRFDMTVRKIWDVTPEDHLDCIKLGVTVRRSEAYEPERRGKNGAERKCDVFLIDDSSAVCRIEIYERRLTSASEASEYDAFIMFYRDSGEIIVVGATNGIDGSAYLSFIDGAGADRFIRGETEDTIFCGVTVSRRVTVE